MKPYEQIAVNFSKALMDGRFADAHSMLDPKLAAEFTPESLGERFRRMWLRYAEGNPHTLHWDPEFSMEDWPGKRERDIGWAYVGVEGDDFVEAVSVVVHELDYTLLIREIEWGRP